MVQRARSKARVRAGGVEAALRALAGGRAIVLVDDARAEPQGSLVAAASKVSPGLLEFMAANTVGPVALAVQPERADALGLSPMGVLKPGASDPAYTIPVDAARGGHRPFSPAGMARTVRTILRPGCRPDDLQRPGHIFPIRTHPGGVLVRAGQAEAALDLSRFAGCGPAAIVCRGLRRNGRILGLRGVRQFAKTHKLATCSVADAISYRRGKESIVERLPSVKFPTKYGRFDLVPYRCLVDGSVYMALCKGGIGSEASGKKELRKHPVLVRMHSQCLTGDTFESLLCDCGQQLRYALRMIAKEGEGVVVYLPQEGRGVGLDSKLRAYHLQQSYGLDTIEANERLGLPADKRSYGVGAMILADLGLSKLRVMTNNPKKFIPLRGYGLEIVERVPIEVRPTRWNRRYLLAKKQRMGHLLGRM